MTGVSGAVRKGLFPAASTKPRRTELLRLNKKKKFPAAAIPKVRAARRADRLGGKRPSDLTAKCAPNTVDFGTWCLMSAPFGLNNNEVGKNSYFFATQKCVDAGRLPAERGAADRRGAAGEAGGTIDDSRLTASIDLDRTDGLKDRREMSSTLDHVAPGSSAAGSQGVTEGSKGDTTPGRADPVPLPANPCPDTLQYVTVYDNGDRGGFAGSKPVGQPEQFRCAFTRPRGAAARKSGRARSLAEGFLGLGPKELTAQ